MKNNKISEQSVREALSMILQFHEIKNSQVLSRFIEFVVEKKLSGREDEIKEYTIAVKGLGKPGDFNPQLDASVRIHAGRLRRILTQYYQGTGKDDAVHIIIPKGRYVPVFTNGNGANGNIPEFALQQEPRPYYIETTHELTEPSKKPVLAVLPFHNLSPEKSKDFFVAGIGEQMSTDLARFHNISVISYFSTSTYNAELKDLKEMKEKANIDYVLTGSIRFINEMVKMNVQLILADNGEMVFTETYSLHLTPENIFEVQDEIVGKILNVIADDHGIIFTNKARASPVIKSENMSVQEAIYKYFDYTREYNTEKFQIAIDALEKAVQTEPDNALASAVLAGLYMDAYIMDVTEEKALLAKAIGLAQSAVKADPHCQHAQKALAWSFLLSGKKEKSFEAIEECIRLNPKNSGIIATMALAYICQGDYDRGFKWLLESINLNPITPPSSKFCFTIFYYHNRNYTESVKWLERISPLETPFVKLLHLALHGKINKKKRKDIDKNIFALKDHANNIIDRMVFDRSLKTEIVDGLELAGLTVK